jgi:hypothetical protein
MATNEKLICSKCGSSTDLDIRFMAIGTSISGSRNNVGVWKIPICKSSLPIVYQTNLKNKINEFQKKSWIYLGVFLTGVLVVMLSITGKIYDTSGPIPVIAMIIVFAGLICGFLLLPVAIKARIENARLLKDFERDGTVPVDQVNEAFKSEGQRILNTLVYKKNEPLEKVWGLFSLTEDTSSNSRPASTNLTEPTVSVSKREIIALGNTIEEMVDRLPAEWKLIWEQPKDIQVKSRLASIIEGQIKGDDVLAYAVAYWDTTSTAVSSVFDKVMGAALLGGLGTQMTGKTHKLGVIAVTKTRFYVIELGELVGEEVTADTLLKTTGLGNSKCFYLKELNIQDSESEITGKLSVTGAIRMNITFPSSFDPGNMGKAAEIAKFLRMSEFSH